MFFWTLLRVDPVPKAYPYLVTMWVTGTEVVGDAILGLAIMADQNLIAGSYYRALGRPWGPSLRADQVIGGGAIWLIGDLIGLPFLGVMLIQMMREDEREAQAVDAELDAAEAGPATADPGHGTTAQPGGERRGSGPRPDGPRARRARPVVGRAIRPVRRPLPRSLASGPDDGSDRARASALLPGLSSCA